MLKKKTIAFYIGLLSPVIAVATIIYGLMTKGFVGQVFETPLIIVLALCPVAAIADWSTDTHFMPILATLIHAAAFGLAIYYGAPTLSDYFNGVNFMGGDLGPVVNYLILTGTALVIRWVISFLPLRVAEKAV